MGKASISIAIGAIWNGSTQIDKVTTDLSRMDKRIAESSRSTQQALASSGSDWERLGQRIYDNSKKVADLGDALTKGVTVPMTQVGTYCVDKAVDFDTAIANLRKTSNLTASQLEDLAQSALELSKTQPVDAATILNIEALGAQLGIADDNLESFARTCSGLDIATDMNAEQAGTEMARFANIVGMTEDQFGNYGSTLVAIGNNMATTESEVSNMALKFASAGRQAGLSSADILGMSAAMSSLGIKSEMGGSALSQVFVSISKAVSGGGEKLDAFAKAAGMSADEFAAAWRGNAADAFNTLIESIGRASANGEDMNVILSDLGITQIRQSDVMRRLAGSTEAVTGKQSVLAGALDLSRQAWEENTALQKEVDQRNESMQSRLDVLKNKVDAIAITVGRPLTEALIAAADSLQPLVDGVADAAQAFADMQPKTQSAVLALAGVTAATGPVLSTVGRVGEAVGVVASAFGKAQGEVAVFRDALDTTDGSQMRVYSSGKGLASRLGTAGNQAAKAAGGVKEYVDAWEGMTGAARRVNANTEKLDSVIDKLDGASGKAAKSLNKQGDALIDLILQDQKAYEENARLVSGWSGSTREAERAADGMKGLEAQVGAVRDAFGKSATESSKLSTGLSKLGGVGSEVGSMLLNGLKAGAVSLAIAGVATVIGMVVEKATEAAAHEELLANATQSAASIMGNAASEAAGLGDAIGEVAIDSDATLQSLADLNTQVSDTFVGFEKSSAKVDQYLAVIDELAGKSGLTATEQWRLEQAISGLNETTGSTWQVVDKANGVIADQSGVVQENTDAIDANAEAWRRKAFAEANANLASQYLEQETEATYKLRQATDELAEKKSRYQELVDKGASRTADESKEMVDLSGTIETLEGQVSDLTDAQDAAADSVAYFSQQADMAASGLDEGLVKTLMELPESVRSCGVDVSNALASGIQSGSVSAEVAAQFVNDLVAGTVAQMPGELQPYGAQAASQLAQGLADGSVSMEQATALLKAIAEGGVQGIPEAYAGVGLDMPQSMAEAISSASGHVTNAVGDLRNDANGAIGPLPGDFSGTGDGAGQSLADAIAAHGGDVESSAGKLRDSAGSGVAETPSDMASTGDSAGASFSSGVASHAGDSVSAGSSLASSASSGVSGSPSELGGYGSDAGRDFASGLAYGESATSSAASSLASAAGGARNYGNAWQWGSDLGRNFASGIGSAIGWVGDAARRIAEKAASVLHFSQPDEGPWAGAERGGVTSGAHLAQNFARGLASQAATVGRASEALAATAWRGLAASQSPSDMASRVSPLAAQAPAATAQASPAQVTNNYTLNIDGRQLKDASPRARECIEGLFSEFGITAGMGVVA